MVHGQNVTLAGGVAIGSAAILSFPPATAQVVTFEAAQVLTFEATHCDRISQSY